MSQPQAIVQEPDFDLQMKSLADEAQQFLDDRSGCKKSQPNLLEFLRPLVQHMDLLSRTMTENTMALNRVEEATSVQAGLPRLVSSINDNIDHKNKLGQKLFDAMHEELRSYKDSFLLDVLHRPVARDLVTLYDDLSELNRQTHVVVTEAQTQPECGFECKRSSLALTQIKNLGTNLDHIVHSVLEILARIEVQRLEPHTGKLDKQRQRVVSLEPAQSQADDLQVSSSVKPGFTWRERMLRPEEVVIKKWKEATPAVSQPQE
jgi:hypothetical protein